MEKEDGSMNLDAICDRIIKEQFEEYQEKLEKLEKVKPKIEKSSNETYELTREEEEARLEKVLFGDKIEYVRKLAAAVGDSLDDDENAVEENKTAQKRKPAWHDSDDELYLVGDVVRETKHNKYKVQVHGNKTYSEYVRSKFSKLVNEPKWAKLDRKVDPDSDEELLQTVGHLGRSTVQTLPSTTIIAKRLKDLNRDTYAEKSITSVQFHPTSTAALVTGFNGVASIYSIDGKRNEKLHNIAFEDFNIKCAKMVRSGEEVLIGGSRKFFYTYDLLKGEETRIVLPRTITKMTQFVLSPCGKYFAIIGRFGEIHLMDLKSKELLHTYKQEYPCSALHFSNDSRKLFAHSEGPEISIFDLRKERIEHRFLDDGCINGSTLAISPSGKMLATGSKEGVVNVYNYDEVFSNSSPRPAKVIYNLTTEITATKFNHSSEILGIASSSVPGAVKLVHFPSGTVFSNFPGLKPNIGNVVVLEFSPNSGFMALGNRAKEVPIYRLKHFSNY